MTIRNVTVRTPFVVERGDPLCARCGEWREHGVHGPLRECAGGGVGYCRTPADHHAYRPIPVWRRFRRAKYWE